MTGTEPTSVIPVEVFVERDVIAPVRIVLKGRVGAEYSPAALLIPQKDGGETTRDIFRHLAQRHLLA